jgi:hypothetical protein
VFSCRAVLFIFVPLQFLAQSACTTTGQTENATQQLESDEDDEESSSEENTSSGYVRRGKFPLPKTATAWDTRALLMTATQPPPGRIAVCQDMVAAVASDASNQDDLAKAQKPMAEAVSKDPEAYHWCFFNLMLKLDAQMEQGGPMLDQQAPTFFTGMRQLWVLSRGLDATLTGNTYFTYLRARYRASSREYFGRNLEIMGPPLKIRPLIPLAPTTSSAKPAGPAPVYLPAESSDPLSD